jgi:GNAT superfamily N-acetyltransferase
VWRSPACPASWFGHRLEFDHPIAPEVGFARWEHEQSGLDIQRRFLVWETPLAVPFPTIAPRWAPFYAIGLARPPGPVTPIASALPIRAAGADLPQVIDAAARQHPQFGDSYLDYLTWLYQGLAERGATTLAARDGDRVVAAATLVPGTDDARFQEVWTAPAHRRRGLATALVTTAIARYADRPLLILAEEGSEAHRLYLRAGFLPISRWVELSTEKPA